MDQSTSINDPMALAGQDLARSLLLQSFNFVLDFPAIVRFMTNSNIFESGAVVLTRADF